MGLMNAINRFDPAKGPSFIGFAVPTMMGEVRRHFRDHTWSMRVPTAVARTSRQIGKATPALIQQLGRAPTASEISEMLGISREEVVECLVAGKRVSARVAGRTRRCQRFGGGDRVVAESVGELDPQIDHITNREAVRAFVAVLPQRERDVLQMRFFELDDPKPDRPANRLLADANIAHPGQHLAAPARPARVASRARLALV